MKLKMVVETSLRMYFWTLNIARAQPKTKSYYNFMNTIFMIANKVHEYHKSMIIKTHSGVRANYVSILTRAIEFLCIRSFKIFNLIASRYQICCGGTHHLLRETTHVSCSRNMHFSSSFCTLEKKSFLLANSYSNPDEIWYTCRVSAYYIPTESCHTILVKIC